LNGPQRESVQLTAAEAAIVRKLQAWRADFPSHASTCLNIIDKQSKLSRLVLNDPQMIIHAKIEAQIEEHGMVRAMVLKGRKQGASTYIGARFYSHTRLWKHRKAKVMAHEQGSTDALFQMVQNYYNHDPLKLGAERASAKQFLFSNGSSYTVATAGGSGEAGRGDTPTLAHLSEAAFYKNPEKNFAGFANSVPIEQGTEVIVESTANGVGNQFHMRWNRAEAGLLAGADAVTYIPIFIPWFLSPEYRLPVNSSFTLSGEAEGEGLPSERDIADMYGLDNRQMAWRRFKLEELSFSIETFMQEYPCTPTEAFQTPGLELFIKPIYVAQARRRRDIQPHGPKILGVDPAGMGGDKFSMTLRQGHVVLWHRGRPGVEPGEEQGLLVSSTMDEEQVDRMNIDYSGGWGTSCLAWIRNNRPDLSDKCSPVDFGAKSQQKTVQPHKPGPRNRRAEMYMRGRDWLQTPEGVSIPDENELAADLGAMTATIGGQSTDTLIEPKKVIKQRLGRSPDTADSWALTFDVPDRTIQTTLTGTRPSGNSRFASGEVGVKTGIETPVVHDPFAAGGSGFDSGGGWMR